jgi:hypothetical protein
MDGWESGLVDSAGKEGRKEALVGSPPHSYPVQRIGNRRKLKSNYDTI